MNYLQCFWYLIVHKYYVWKFGRLLRANPWQLLIHDWTKLSPIQIRGYVDWFINKQIITESTYFALHDHFRREKHHWNYWTLFLDNGDPSEAYSVVCLPMPDQQVRIMIADWASAGLMKKGYFDLLEYYAVKRNQILLHRDTQQKVERYTKELDAAIRRVYPQIPRAA